MNDEFESLPIRERAFACRTKASELLAQAESASPEIGDELRTLATQWLMLAEKLESKDSNELLACAGGDPPPNPLPILEAEPTS
jgi:hypothetical protein